MANTLDICNLALSHVAAYPIQSLDERTKEARECKRLYSVARDAMLEAHDWGIARKQAALALLDEEVSGWDYVYAWPTDCIVPRKIYDPSEVAGSTPIKFEFRVNEDLNRRVIVTNEEDAELIYTAKITDANLFTSMMVDALGFRLASDLAIPLRSDSKLQVSMLNQFLARVTAAQASSANAEEKPPETISDFQKARS